MTILVGLKPTHFASQRLRTDEPYFEVIWLEAQRDGPGTEVLCAPRMGTMPLALGPHLDPHLDQHCCSYDHLICLKFQNCQMSDHFVFGTLYPPVCSLYQDTSLFTDLPSALDDNPYVLPKHRTIIVLKPTLGI